VCIVIILRRRRAPLLISRLRLMSVDCGRGAEASTSVAARGGRRPGPGHTALVILVGAAVALALFVAVARAVRPAHRAERQAIRSVLLRTWRRTCASRPFRYKGARVSTVDARYAYGEIADNSCNYLFGWFLARPQVHGQRWRIVAHFQDSLDACSYFRRHLPEPVIRDFHVQGANSEGIITNC
jgi:hypothetical protein